MRLGTVRRARAGDAQAIAAVHVTASRETYAILLPAERLNAFSVGRRARNWRQVIEAPNEEDDTAVFVAEEGNAVVGFGCCSRQRTAGLAAMGFNGEFQATYVLRAAQGRGFGRKLMAAMAQHLTARSISGGSCWVLRENDQAHRFCEALGGQRAGERVERPRGGPALVEVAYGWRHLASITNK